MRIFGDLFENGTIAEQYYERRCNERTSDYLYLVFFQCMLYISYRSSIFYLYNNKQMSIIPSENLLVNHQFILVYNFVHYKILSKKFGAIHQLFILD